jgi:hypothetical protein
MADDLFNAVTAKCDVCEGRGLRDATDDDAWQVWCTLERSEVV